MNTPIPGWYSSFSVYVDLCDELIDIYSNVYSMSFKERWDNPFKVVKPIIDMATLISRIVPFRIDESTHDVAITSDDNLDYLTSHLSYVGVELRDIISSYNNLLFNLGALRNKYEHVPHLISAKYAGGSANASDAIFELPNRSNASTYEITIATDDIEWLIIDISKVILKVIKHIVGEVEQAYKGWSDHPYQNHLKKAIEKIDNFISVYQ